MGAVTRAEDDEITKILTAPIDARDGGLFGMAPTVAAPPADILDTITALYRKIRDQQRIVACCDSDTAQGVQRLIDHHGVAGLYEVIVSPGCPDGHIVIFDRHPVRDLADEFPQNWSWSARDPQG